MTLKLSNGRQLGPRIQGMRDVLRGSLARSLAALSEADRLASAWPVACGRVMAEHGELISFEQGNLRIQVSDGAWLRQMLSMRNQLQHELARIAGVPITGIHFELKR
jgi:predicted nucleic acid-binding Zn ribbon protein